MTSWLHSHNAHAHHTPQPHAKRPVWLFDLDNTLHDANPHIFPRINHLMNAYVMEHLKMEPEAAGELRHRYWMRYGATLLGLVRHHGVDPHHFLHHTHQFPNLAQQIVYEPALATLLRRLPGRKVIFSNAPRAYVTSVLKHISLLRAFDDIFTIESLRFQPKPHQKAFREVLHALRIPAHRCIMVEDTAVNLRTARQLGMKTVWISRSTTRPTYVDVKLRSILDIRKAL